MFLPVGLMPQVDNIVTVRFHPFGVDRDITKLCSVLPNVPFSAIVGQHPHLQAGLFHLLHQEPTLNSISRCKIWAVTD